MTNSITAQEIFDLVWDHFVTRKQPLSVGDQGDCLYRGPHGTKCAVGILVSDEECTGWDDVMIGVYTLAAKGQLPSRLIPHKNLLVALQDAHDSARIYGNLEERLRDLAKRFSLRIPEVQS